ncbi:MAG: hypothetical protein ACSHXY_09465 [Alphaproteobacteria bacterium]
MKRFLVLTIAVSASMSSPAFSKDKSDTREAPECLPAEDIIKLFSKFDGLKPERRDTLEAALAARFIADTPPMPDRLYMKDGGVETPFTIEADGQISDFSKLKKGSKDTELCVDDPSRAGLKRKDDGLSFSIDFDIKFKKSGGSHSLAELEDGTDDGKSFYKKLFPGPAKLLVPKMTHVAVTYKDKGIQPNIHAMKADAALQGLIIEPFAGMHVIDIAAFKNMGADTLAISGGAYTLEPVPSIKKMKSLGFGEGDDNEDDSKAK